MVPRLRRLDDPALSPARNMAIDEVLALGLANPPPGQAHDTPVILRCYRWDPPTLSFGYAQDMAAAVSVAAARAAGLGLVRRVTGGRMVLHHHELTFSVAARLDWLHERVPGPTDFLARFRTLMQPIVTALCALGLPATFAEPIRRASSTDTGRDPHCFATHAGHSILLDGRKLVGAAGLVRDGVMMIHGAMILAASPLPAGIQPDTRGAKAPPTAELGRWLPAERITALPGLIAAQLAVDLDLTTGAIPDRLTDAELTAVAHLCEKYADLDWHRRPDLVQIQAAARDALLHTSSIR